MKISREHRKRLMTYLHEFYKCYPGERFKVFHVVKMFKDRCRKKRKGKYSKAGHKDAWSAICGDTGTGKSYLAIIMGILFGRTYDLTKNVTYIPLGDEIVNKFDKMDFNVLQVDEAAKEMRSVNWQSKAQQKVNVKAMTDRFKNNWVMLIMPNFDEFTKSMRRGSLMFRFVVLFRNDKYARIVLHRKSKNFRSSDPWCDKMASDKYEKIEVKGKEITNEIMLNIERGLPNYVMDFIVPNLELILPDVTTEYKRLKIESRKIAANDDRLLKPGKMVLKYKKKYELAMARAAQALYNNTLGIGHVRIKKGHVAKELDMNTSTLNRYLKMNIKEIESNKNFRKKI